MLGGIPAKHPGVFIRSPLFRHRLHRLCGVSPLFVPVPFSVVSSSCVFIVRSFYCCVAKYNPYAAAGVKRAHGFR